VMPSVEVNVKDDHTSSGQSGEKEPEKNKERF
jgi:hypothetical protein